MYSLGVVLLVDIYPALSEHTLWPRSCELLSLSSTLSACENCSWQRKGSFYVRLLVSCGRHSLLTAIVDTTHSDRSSHGPLVRYMLG